MIEDVKLGCEPLGKKLLRQLAVSAACGLATASILISPILPWNGFITEWMGMIWTNYAAHLLLCSWIAILVVIPIRRRVLPFIWSCSISAAATAALILSVQVYIFQLSVRDAGGVTSLPSALLLRAYDSEPPDLIRGVARVEGSVLRAAIWRPATGARKAPVMVDVHGGAWSSGSPVADGTSQRWFARRGWLVISVDYRLSRPGYPTWDKAPLDVGCGLAWVKRYAATLGGDPNHIVITGRSAGGNLAINVAYAAASGTADSSCGGEVPIPNAVVALTPVVDPAGAFRNGVALPGADPRLFISRYIGGSPDVLADRVRAIASASYLSPKAPPTLIIEPIHDRLIPAADVFHFTHQARRAGVPVTTAALPMINHHLRFANSLADQAVLTIAAAFVERRLPSGNAGNHP